MESGQRSPPSEGIGESLPNSSMEDPSITENIPEKQEENNNDKTLDNDWQKKIRSLQDQVKMDFLSFSSFL